MTVELIRRRDFLAALGVGAGALALRVKMPFAQPSGIAGPAFLSPGVYLSIDNTGLATITVHRSEMGQGVRTSIPMVIADELEADWTRVKIAQAPGHPSFGNQNTDGSRSIRTMFTAFRTAGATAREMLISAAAKKWRVPASQCKADNHQVVHTRSGKKLDYKDLVRDASALEIPKIKPSQLKKRSEFRYIGKSKPIVDGDGILDGTAKFGADISLPNMLVAVIARPPAVGDAIESVDDKATLAVPGVKKVVQLPVANLPSAFKPLGGVAVLATNTWAAIRGRDALVVNWKPSQHRSYSSEPFRKTLEDSARNASTIARKTGDVDAALGKAAKRISAEYYAPLLSQAPMEPPVALADVRDGGATIWTSVQTPQAARGEVATALGVKPDKVTVNVTLLGGGFGRKSKPDFCTEAALLSKEAGVPVRVQWTREDDLRHGFFHTVSAQKVEGGLDSAGRVVAWKHQTAFPPIGGTFGPTTSPGSSELGMGLTDLPFAIPNVQIAAGDAEVHVRTGWLRSVANVYHAFAVGSFVDELAHAAGRDPRELWLELCAGDRPLDLNKLGITTPWNYGESGPEHAVKPARLRKVIERACELADWKNARAAGRALGLSAHRSFASYCAVVIEVSKPKDGRHAFRIERATSVIDAGQIVSRDRVLAQLEGAIAYGLSAALEGQITVTDGQIDQSNFHDYRVLRINDAPRVVTTDIIDSGAAPGGVGEPGMPPVAPALANAIFALSGVRHREIPVRKIPKRRRE